MQNSSEFKFLNFLCMFYVSISILAVTLLYKIIDIHGFIFSATTILMPLWFFTLDIITELYGYNIAKKVVWSVILCELIFVIFAYILVLFPSPISSKNQSAYIQIFSQLPMVLFGSFCAKILANFSNMYLLSKYKIFYKGKYLFQRIIICSAIGEFIFTITALSIELFGKMKITNIIEIITISYLYKFILLILGAWPTTIVINYIKQKEEINVNEVRIDYNPFRF